MSEYDWIIDIEKYVLAEWMRTGLTDGCAKRKQFDNIDNWCVYEDTYASYAQNCFICVKDMRWAKNGQKRLEKVIEKLNLSKYFWSDYGRANEDYENAPVIILGANYDVLKSSTALNELQNVYTLLKLREKI